MIVTLNFQLSFLRYQPCFIVLYQKGPHTKTGTATLVVTNSRRQSVTTAMNSPAKM